MLSQTYFTIFAVYTGLQTTHVWCKVCVDSSWIYAEGMVASQRSQYHVFISGVGWSDGWLLSNRLPLEYWTEHYNSLWKGISLMEQSFVMSELIDWKKVFAREQLKSLAFEIGLFVYTLRNKSKNVELIECFHLPGEQPCKFNWNRRKGHTKKDGHQYGCGDVTRKRFIGVKCQLNCGIGPLKI